MFMASDLSDWLCRFWSGPEYKAWIARLADVALRTPTGEVAFLAALIEHAKPRRTLEIGSLFGQTSRVMAEALPEGGRLTTIDPYGGERLPDIIASWPEGLRNKTKFLPVTSGRFFSDLDHVVVAQPEELLDLVFIDGNHEFPFALFDILASADYLTPGGVLLVDNVEQAGPRLAILEFLTLNPAWRVFYGGAVTREPVFSTAGLPLGGPTWAILLSPEDIQVGTAPRKFRGKGGPGNVYKEVTLNVTGGDAEVASARFSVRSYPFDFHLTGHGWQEAHASVTCRRSDKWTADFEKPVTVERRNSDAHFVWELTLAIQCGYLLLDPTKPVLLA
jgi:hypothetical protein